jgi:transcriptional regulator with XRE-family HTH domain
MTLGNAIKTVRTASRVKQRELATRAGVTANYISLVEGDKREPSVTLLKKIADSLEIPVSFFFLWQEYDGEHADSKRMEKIRDLLLGLETSYLFNKRAGTVSKRGRRK